MTAGAWLTCGGGKIPTEEFVVAVAVNPGKEVDDDVVRERDVPLALGIVQAAAEVGEGGEAATGTERSAR